jgi:7-cyano-7-deazaguanine synthase
VQALDRESALVLYSGGQDSAITFAWALSRYARVFSLGFDYGQRHSIELTQRVTLQRAMLDLNSVWAARFQSDHVLDIGALGAISETSLTRATLIENDSATGLPTTFVPGRNLIFIGFAAALAYRLRARALVGGMCEADYSGYPDCRREALDAQIAALRAGMDADFTLETPLSALTKAQSWRLAEELGGAPLVDAIVEHSHSCYLGERGVRHSWGYGCGACPACELRARGWGEYAAAAL